MPQSFPGPDLSAPATLNGLNYGILSTGDNLTTGNTPILTEPLIKKSVTFTFNTIGFTLASIGNVSFQYGTALTEPNIRVSEPVSVLLLGAGLARIGIWRRKSVSLYEGASPRYGAGPSVFSRELLEILKPRTARSPSLAQTRRAASLRP